MKTNHLFQPHFIFIVFFTLTDQIDSNTHFIVSAVGSFGGQINSNLISLSVLQTPSLNTIVSNPVSFWLLLVLLQIK